MTTLAELFHEDPTRELEEVQKVNARERAATDVREFYETDSAQRVLTELGELVETYPTEEPRFLYLHATFGSGKTHLLKLIGFVADDESEFAEYGDQLAGQWPGFDRLQQSIEDSHVDRLKPVFLNLLDRDAAEEPPLPFLIYQAIGRELGYPTDPNWLLEWAWTLDMEYEGIWPELTAVEHDGQTFDDVLAERATLRSWLYSALPALDETTGTPFETESGVRKSIEEAESDIDPESFGPSALVDRVNTATEALNAEGRQTELLLGLDEVALFVGDSKQRYRRFEETMEALQQGPNPVVITTGQYSLPETRESLIGETAEGHWTRGQILLEGADTEIIVRRRWLDKSNAGADQVADLLESLPDLTLDTYESVASEDPSPVESYPFRSYDLTLLRQVMQELITQGRPTDRQYIQGRALLVLVRSLFTKFEWADAEAGALVPWDQLFDLLVEETTYVPLWVQEMLDNTLIPTFDGDPEAFQVRVSKALYLLNQAPGVPSTPANLGRLLIDDVEASLDEVVASTESALDELVEKRKALTETTDEGDEVYTLVSEEQESILSRAQTEAERVSPHQLSAWLETRLREADDFFRSDETRHAQDVGSERKVPLRYAYSIHDSVDRSPSLAYDAIKIRVLAATPDTLSDEIGVWQEVNEGRDGGEHVLIAIEIPDSMLDRIRSVIGMRTVLENETGTHEELEREHRTDKRRLESQVTEILDGATVHTVDGRAGDRSTSLASTIAEQVQSVFGPTRRTLTQPLSEVQDAKAMAAFFRGAGEWPLSATDAETLGVDTETATLTEGGWCQSFIDTHEPGPIDVETILKQTRTSSGDYRGTPQESIAALLITLATSNADVALKEDTDYLSEPEAIGRGVRAKGRLTSLQVHFDVDDILDSGMVRDLVTAVRGEEPEDDDPDAWLQSLGAWVDENSVLVKRTIRGVEREFDISLDAFDTVIQPALDGEELSTSSLSSDVDLDQAVEEAQRFDDARPTVGEMVEGTTRWEQFTAALETMTDLHPSASITDSMRVTAESETVPSVSTVEKRIEDAETYRVDALAERYRQITGETAVESEPEAVCEALGEWLRSNESQVQTVVDQATDEFDGLDLDALVGVFEDAWGDGSLEEADLVTKAVEQQAERYAAARELFDETDGEALWTQLEAVQAELQADHAESPTTARAEAMLERSQPPKPGQVRQVLKRAVDPLPPDEVLSSLEALSTELQDQLPAAEITDRVAELLNEEEPSRETASELLDEAETVLDRIGPVNEHLDAAADGTLVAVLDDNED
jgi:hypothetical protein